jgi:hypothetical protein
MESIMSPQNEGTGPLILFAVTWWILAHQPDYEDHAFIYALLLMFVGWLAIRLGGDAVSRLGSRAWVLMLQLGVWSCVFLWLVPGIWYLKTLALWGYAVPLVFAGGAARMAYEGARRSPASFSSFPRAICAIGLLLGLVAVWRRNGEYWPGLWEGALELSFAAIALFYGWQLGQPVVRHDRDARFGSYEDYRSSGLSDER